ncbi:DUF7768 domain-containing protein [Paramaledivibacter caminithermalis]|uniref:DUF7768 domain-containing protein n=1 Tax=Paramaledivibacter caminithermalis (strain DSM 15212 / CIP 107654 / DViRD3) TaxID=1121301 RepID=A0A1M6THD2_PARC5|nr:hypothetical protein [Paramaledivibacter caminithermalis]SHK56350.1 hypothetical protein SAMN02745912_03685 [Paramaledivibacter caminithermalis DSM 15212]
MNITKANETNIEQEKPEEKKIVFICSPFAGDIEGNTERARRYGRFVSVNSSPRINNVIVMV